MEKDSKCISENPRPPLSSSCIKDYWNQFGSTYSANHETKTILNGISELEKCLQKFKTTSKLKLLELACGSGYLAKYIIKNHADQFSELSFFDISGYMVERTRERLKPLVSDNNTKIIIEERNCEDFTDMPDRHYDIILANLVVHIVENPDNVFKGLQRCLSDHGSVFISYLDELEKCSFFNNYQQILSKYNVDKPKNRTMFYFAKENVIERLVNEFGFEIIEESVYNAVFNEEGFDIMGCYIEMLGFNKMKEKLGTERYNELVEEIKEMVDEYDSEKRELNVRIINKHLRKRQN